MNIGSLVIDLEGKKISESELELLNHPLVGGVILFTRNFESRAQLTSLCQSIRSSREKPILIMADQEGGRVQRFKKDFTLIPPMGELGKLFDEDAAAAMSLARDVGFLLAGELLACCIDLNLGPVLDLDTRVSEVIGNRAFHSQPEVVSVLAKEVVKGMSKAGMAAVGKHFPGHGSVVMDSHTVLAEDQRSFDEVIHNDLIPFKSLIQFGTPAIMASHIIYPKVDKNPVSYSRKWLKDVLRINLAFNGTVFSDDLSMEGANISSYYPDRVLAAREAGCDFTIICNQRKGVLDCLDKLNVNEHQVEESRWSNLLGKYHSEDFNFNDDKWQLIRDRISVQPFKL